MPPSRPPSPPAASTSAQEYNVALAIEDFVPVVLAAAALVITAQAVGTRVPRAFPVALIGAVVVVAGRSGQGDLEAPGRHRLLGVPDPGAAALPVPGLRVQRPGLGAAQRQARQRAARLAVRGLSRRRRPSAPCGWATNWPLLIAAAVSATVLGITAAVMAFRAGKPGVGVLFILYVLGTNILPPLAAQPKQSAELQWAEQLTNSAVQLCFLLGALWLREHLTSKANEDSAEHRTGVSRVSGSTVWDGAASSASSRPAPTRSSSPSSTDARPRRHVALRPDLHP